MVQNKIQNVEDYINNLTSVRQDTINRMRKIILDNLPLGYKEIILYGMLSYVIPLETYPKTYNNQPLLYIALAAQKNYYSLYLMNIYGDLTAEHWFKEEYQTSGKRLNMGKSCVRFKELGDLPLDLIVKVIKKTSVQEFIQKYESVKKIKKT